MEGQTKADALELMGDWDQRYDLQPVCWADGLPDGWHWDRHRSGGFLDDWRWDRRRYVIRDFRAPSDTP